jgi:hypothetical protein
MQDTGADHIESTWGVPFNGHMQAPILCMYWQHLRPAARRPGFPSWSPLGWIGPVHFLPIMNQYRPSEDQVAKIRFSYQIFNSNNNAFLEITAIVSRSPIEHLKLPSRHPGREPYLVLPCGDGRGSAKIGYDFYVPIRWDTTDLSPTLATCALTQTRSLVSDIIILLLRPHDGDYKRIGIATSWYEKDGGRELQAFEAKSPDPDLHGTRTLALEDVTVVYKLVKSAAADMAWSHVAKEETIILC